LEADAIQADAMTDLRTENNALSVWRIDDDRVNLEQIIVALALAPNVSQPTHIDCALFDEQFLASDEFKFEQVPGNTRCVAANNYHSHLTELSVQKLSKVAKIIKAKAERKRYSKKETIAFVSQAIDSGIISRAELPPAILAAIDLRTQQKASGEIDPG